MTARWALWALLAAMLWQWGPAAAPAEAQYFGRNKVQYRKFHFEVLRTEHFDIYYYPEGRVMAEQAGRMAERWYARLSRQLGYDLSSRQALILYTSHPDFEQTNAIPGELGEGTGGVTEAFKRRIVLPMAGPIADTDHVIGHELVHAFQFDVTGQSHSDAGFANPAILRLPLWFIEGMAEYLSVGPVDPNTAMWIRDAAQSDKLPTVRTLGDPRFFPYRYGQAFWSYVASRWGEGAVARCLKAAGRAGDAELALTTELGLSPDSLSKDWHRAIRQWYAPIAAATQAPSAFARPVAIAGQSGGELNVAPAVSPEGDQLVFFSEKDLFSIEMYLADLETGEVERKLTRTAVDPHFQSLQFIRSAGAWSHDGRRFVFAGITQGRPVLTVLDAERGRRVQELKLRELGEVLNPTWAPDGRRVAFSALQHGRTDLFWADLESGELRRLTDDLYSDLHPAWSPDGSTIAFASDRFTTDLDSLRYGHYRLVLYDVATGGMRELPGFDDGKNVNPQWSRDGASLYFVSDHSGISNVYRLALDAGDITRVTNVRTGVSGITDLSPAISMASDADRLVFTVYEQGAFNLYAIDSLSTLRGAEIPAPLSAFDPAVLPADTLQAPRDSIATAHYMPGPALPEPPSLALPLPGEPPQQPRWLLAAADTTGAAADSARRARPFALPDTSSFTTRPYKARLSLDYVAQPNISFGATTSGLVAGGGAAAYWSDMLGDHNLATFLQVNTGGGSILRNTAVGVFYENRRSRWNWGVDASQFPLITRDYYVDRGFYNDEPATRERDFRVWEIHRDVGGTLAYPINRVHRIELDAGFSSIDFAGEVETRIYSDLSGDLLAKYKEDLPENRISTLNFARGGGALVYDSSIFGGTGPVMGQRYRVGASAAVGSIDYYSALFDYRRYVPLARSLILAGRVLHYGRYGGGSDDLRLEQLYLGYPSLIRGYDSGSFTGYECVGTPEDPVSCPVYDRLFGSRLALANFEVRVPILGALGVIPSRGVPPVDVAGFFDIGVAWTGTDKAWFNGGSRDPVTSYGGALRINLLGFAIAEIDFVHPNDRPGKGWYWQFSLTPGF